MGRVQIHQGEKTSERALVTQVFTSLISRRMASISDLLDHLQLRVALGRPKHLLFRCSSRFFPCYIPPLPRDTFGAFNSGYMAPACSTQVFSMRMSIGLKSANNQMIGASANSSSLLMLYQPKIRYQDGESHACCTTSSLAKSLRFFRSGTPLFLSAFFRYVADSGNKDGGICFDIF
jgi:hypothetical protein